MKAERMQKKEIYYDRSDLKSLALVKIMKEIQRREEKNSW